MLPIFIPPTLLGRNRYRCPNCSLLLSLEDDQCPHCHKSITVEMRVTMKRDLRKHAREGVPVLIILGLLVIALIISVGSAL